MLIFYLLLEILGVLYHPSTPSSATPARGSESYKNMSVQFASKPKFDPFHRQEKWVCHCTPSQNTWFNCP